MFGRATSLLVVLASSGVLALVPVFNALNQETVDAPPPFGLTPPTTEGIHVNLLPKAPPPVDVPKPPPCGPRVVDAVLSRAFTSPALLPDQSTLSFEVKPGADAVVGAENLTGFNGPLTFSATRPDGVAWASDDRSLALQGATEDRGFAASAPTTGTWKVTWNVQALEGAAALTFAVVYPCGPAAATNATGGP